MTSLSPLRAASDLPPWLPDAVKLYLSHIDEGQSLRALARREGVNASTVMRQVRRYESRRDDPLMDGALAALSLSRACQAEGSAPQDLGLPDAAELAREGGRILRRLIEPHAVLAFASDMEKAVVMRELPQGRATRTAVLERKMAQAFCLKEWISCRKSGRISIYEITSLGRAALREMIAAEEGASAEGLAESQSPFAAQHRIAGERLLAEGDGLRRLRVNLAESPVNVLGRKRDKEGRPFLEAELVDAAERLREDFELAQMGPRVAQNWERFLTGGDRGGFGASRHEGGNQAAKDRVALALRDLGPGLGDIALRVCCFLEGVETAEQRMGWAARSGKIVLRIALMRLRRHYDQTYGRAGPLIG